jgi:predicted transcriptional regulator
MKEKKMVQRVKYVMHAYVLNIHGITKVSDALSIMKDENIQAKLAGPRNDEMYMD